MQIFTAALFVIAPNLKQPKYPSTGEWVNKKRQTIDTCNNRDDLKIII